MAQAVLVICAVVLTVAPRRHPGVAQARDGRAGGDRCCSWWSGRSALWRARSSAGGGTCGRSQSANRERQSDQRRGPPRGGTSLQDRAGGRRGQQLASFRGIQRRRLGSSDGAQRVCVEAQKLERGRTRSCRTSVVGTRRAIGLVLLGAIAGRRRRVADAQDGHRDRELLTEQGQGGLKGADGGGGSAGEGGALFARAASTSKSSATAWSELSRPAARP